MAERTAARGVIFQGRRSEEADKWPWSVDRKAAEAMRSSGGRNQLQTHEANLKKSGAMGRKE